jgi:hypothetical protein
MDEIHSLAKQGKLNCCCCETAIPKAEKYNSPVLDKIATWNTPTIKSAQDTKVPPAAIAVVCDACLKKKMPIHYAIEIYVEDFKPRIVYHLVDDLKDLPDGLGIDRVRRWWVMHHLIKNKKSK